MNTPGRTILAIAALALSATAHARDITVTVRDAGGHPVEDAVVTLNVPGRAPPPAHFTISQKNTMFAPFVLVIPVGSTVDFTNLDPFHHHVYSFSPAKKFELKLFGKGEKRSVTFDKPGTVALGCNIHDTMQAFIHVVDTPYAGRSGSNGRVVLKAVPASARTVRVWHPRLRAPGNELKVSIDPGRDVALPVTVKLRRPPPAHHAY